LPRVLEGLFSVAEQLFGVKIVERQGVPVYHPDARFFEIVDASGKARAGFYLDACARAKKRAGAWMDDCVGRKDFGAEHTVPVAYLVCNFLPAAPAKPALLTHDDVVTMFHEFGHGLHHMLTRVGYPSISGINGVSWDAVELPSQFLENFAWRPEVLATMARHFETGAPLPAEQQRQLLGSRTFTRASRRCGSSSSRCSISACTPNTIRRVVRASRRSSAKYVPRSPCSRCPNGTGSRTTSAIFSPADMPRVTTATNGPKSLLRMLSQPSRNTACSIARSRSVFSMPSCPPAAAARRSTRSSSFADARRT
jgi:hypothetical protein